MTSDDERYDRSGHEQIGPRTLFCFVSRTVLQFTKTYTREYYELSQLQTLLTQQHPSSRRLESEQQVVSITLTLYVIDQCRYFLGFFCFICDFIKCISCYGSKERRNLRSRPKNGLTGFTSIVLVRRSRRAKYVRDLRYHGKLCIKIWRSIRVKFV